MTTRTTDRRKFGDVDPSIGVRRAVRVDDESVNKSIRRGEYAIFKLAGADFKLEPGLLVYVERFRGDLVERSVRLVVHVGGKLQLACHSTDERYTDCIPYPSRRRGETITIVGAVVGKYTDLRVPPACPLTYLPLLSSEVGAPTPPGG